MDDLNGISIKGYELLEQIGQGGFGAVYRAYHTAVGREVAIKAILPQFANNPEFIRRFEIEALTIAQLEHMNIAPLYDFWRDPSGAYLVMRYFKGGSLAQALRGGAYHLQATALLLDQIAAALTVAHRNHIIHRDLKPANILLDEDGNAYLADFGIAKSAIAKKTKLTNGNAIIGSLDYISPEQARGEPVSPRTDIYSLGVILYEMLTGEHPFPDLSSVERLYRHLNDPLPLIKTLDGPSASINNVIQTATMKDPTRRFQDVISLALAFREAAGSVEQDKASESVEPLTRREMEIIQLIITGRSNKEIAQEMIIEQSTVKWYIHQIYRKLGVRSRTQCIVRARELHLASPQQIDTAQTIRIDQIDLNLLPQPQNPYKGLRAFQTSDARNFFGREKLIENLLSRLQEDDDFSRFLAIIGPSGSGKSSVVYAGLIPALWRGEIPGSDRWYIVNMLPGAHPVDDLETALMRIAADQAHNLHEPLLRDSSGLVRATQLILPNDESELVLIIDQFEEVFTVVTDEAERRQFLDLIYTAVTTLRSRIRIVLTLRADFYDKPLHYPEFGEMLRARMATILPLSAEELNHAISKPAERVGISFEEGLVAKIISDIHYQPGALPLLQYALTELFDKREGRILTHKAYEEIGRSTGALGRSAETVYSELDAGSRELTHQMFLRLITLGEGVEDTRRRTARAELLDLTPDKERMEEVIDTYTAYRLLSLDHDPLTRGPIVEVAHEAVLREWRRLRAWLDESRIDIRQQRLLSIAAADWLNSDRDPSYLLHGARLEQAEAWAATTKLALTPNEHEFLKKSVLVRAEEEDFEHQRQERELKMAVAAAEAAQQAAAAQRTAANRLRYMAGGLTVFLVIALLLSAFALDREWRAESALDIAEREASVNHSLVLANEAVRVYQTRGTDLALSLALEAVNIESPPPEAISALQTVAWGLGKRAIFQERSHPITAVAISSSGNLGLSAGCAIGNTDPCPLGEWILWDMKTGASVRRSEGHAGFIRHAAFHPDESLFITGGDDGLIILWDPASGAELRRFTEHTAAITGIVFSADEQTVYSSDESGMLLVWDIRSGAVLSKPVIGARTITKISLRSDGQVLAIGHDDGIVSLWDTSTWVQQKQLDVGEGKVISLAFRVLSNSQFTLVTATLDLHLREWDVQTGQMIHTESLGDKASNLIISADGHIAAMCQGPNNRYVLLDSWTHIPSETLVDESKELRAFAFSPDNQQVLVGYYSGELHLLNMPFSGQLRQFRQDVPQFALALSPDGRRLITGRMDGTALSWDLATGEIIWRYDDLASGVTIAGYSPDGEYVLLQSADWFGGSGEIANVLVDAESGRLLHRLDGNQYGPRSYAFSSDGRLLITGSFGWGQSDEGAGEMILWNVQTGELVRRFETDRMVFSVAFSPDNQMAIVSHSQHYPAVTLWDLATGRKIREFPYVSDTIMSVVTYVKWGPGADTVLIAGISGLVEFDIVTGTIKRTLTGQDQALVTAFDHSPDWRYLVSGDNSVPERIVLWDFRSGEAVRRYSGVSSFTWEILFSPDGQRFYTSAYSGPVIEWQVAAQPLPDLIQWVRENRYVRELSCEERTRYRIEPLCQSPLS